MEQAVLHNGLQNEVRHQHLRQVGVNVVLHPQLGIPAAHQLHVGFQQLQFFIQRHQLLICFHAEAEEIHQPHQKAGNLFVTAELSTDADGIQSIIEKMGVDLAFQVQHGHFLLRQFAAQNGGILQRQIEGHGHEGQSHAADEPGGVDGLQNRHAQLDGQGKGDDAPLLPVQLLPVAQKQHYTQNQIIQDTQVTHHHMDAVGIVALWGLGVVDGKQQVACQGKQQKDLRRPIQPPGPGCLLLRQNGNILIEQEYRQYHRADEGPVELVVEQHRHRVQMVHRIDRGGIEQQMDLQNDQQQGKGLVQSGISAL